MYNIPFKSYPNRANEASGISEAQVCVDSQEEDWDQEIQDTYYVMPLSNASIHIVNTRDKLHDAMDRLTKVVRHRG